MNRKCAKPFLKWAGGKTQLIPEIKNSLPNSVVNKRFTYIEPFVGSGAVLFWMLGEFPRMEKAVINDINEDLINTYKTIRSSPKELISILDMLQKEYHVLDSDDDRKKEYYCQKRDLFNRRKQEQTVHSALFIFLNRTCFNGLYRVNRKNEFNVPTGSYKKPTICDRQNLLAVSEALQNVELLCGDFEQTADYANSNAFFYFDPPYKPLSETSSFNSYSKDEFNDKEQIRLKVFCDRLDSLGHSWLLSNSDNDFFDRLYSNCKMSRVLATRMINCKSNGRGKLTEILVKNYKTKQSQQVINF
ncbi:MAG: DNA adenine methylase [Bacteroidales bacterium]|jgi:DNA adenine methylase|nr:DNA adenine methylase [Bacteroidales bacterium]